MHIIEGGVGSIRRYILVPVLLLLAGCSAQLPEAGKSMVVSTAGAVANSRVSPAVTPSSDEVDPITSDNMRSQLIPYESNALGARLDYPENLGEPEIVQAVVPTLKLLLGNGELSIFRTEETPETTLQDLAKQRIDSSMKASNGRIVSTDLGQQRLGGDDAWGIRYHFDSAAGRRDGITYVVRADGFEYWVNCQTKQGPPVTPWEAVAPVCQRVIETMRFGS